MPGSRRNPGRIALIAVLALSLLGNALTAGAILRFQSMRGALLGPAGDSALFPKEIRRDLRASVKENSAELKSAIHDLARARAEIVRTGTTEPLDEAALRAAMDRFRSEMDKTVLLTQDVVIEVLRRRAAQESQ